jgi:uncharacterized protein YndB with AHSA1/START domain
LASTGIAAALAIGSAADAPAQAAEMTLSKTNIGAPPEKVFVLVEDFRNWSQWSPHEKADPAVQRSYGGAAKGQGATYQWNGDGEVGQGSAQIVRSEPARSMAVEFDLQKPVSGRLTVEFTFATAGAAGTRMDVATKGGTELVNYVMKTFFSDSLMRVACVVEGSSTPFCTFLMKDVGKQ